MTTEPVLGYCTNVHAGADLEQAWANLKEFAPAVRRQACGDRPLGVGLWLSAQAATELVGGGRLDAFAGWLAEERLIPFTMNGFPYGNFHQTHVKHAVYRPTWYDRDRLEYTLTLFAILDRLLPQGDFGTISTLPIAWGEPGLTAEQRTAAAVDLGQVIRDLAKTEADTGRRMMLCLEPEPGCELQFTAQAIAWITEIVPTEADLPLDVCQRYLGLCHDICHAAVMFESQADVVRQVESAGVSIGKVQVSSAIRAKTLARLT